VEYYIAGTIFLSCAKLTLHLEGLSINDDASCDSNFAGSFGTVLAVADICVVFLGLSGVLALAQCMEPLLAPAKRDVVTLRHRMFVYMQTYIAFQTIVVFGIILPQVTTLCDTQHIEGLTIAVQMLIFQFLANKGFVPRFTWGPWHSMPNMPTEADRAKLKAFEFLVPVAEMASKFDKNEAKDEVAIELRGGASGAQAANV
jgi:hypothetical protein